MNKEQVHGAKAWEASVRKSQAASATRRRGNGIFGSVSVAHVDDEDCEGDVNAASDEVYHAEKLLSNGDYYTGEWSGRLPHGHGKYLWTDGCMYVGEWHKGRTMGKGKFCWPSGATYEGDFNNGFMDGTGTYTGPSGDSYKGSWTMNLKHGQGTKSYVNGDLYEGEWRRGSQHGHGRYQWSNGNCYIGQWKNGVINGNGTMIWSNGNRYEGFWEDGVPKGNGTFRWVDGSCYVGFWSKDPKEQRGTYHAADTPAGNDAGWDPQTVFDVDLGECLVSPAEKVSVLPSQKVLGKEVGGDVLPKQSHREPSKGENGSLKPPRKSSGDTEDRGEGLGSVQKEDCNHVGTPTRHWQLRIRPVKRQGEIISKGNKNYELMLNLQLGIRHSVSRPAPANTLDLKPSAFDPKEKVWTKFPPEGSKHTPPHQSSEFRWKDYCPVVFRSLRKLFMIDAADYMISLCGDDALREISSQGKSGSFFYLTNDDRYMIKTLKKAEVKVLLRMLPTYYKHVRKYQNTLLTKFFGLHCVKLTGAIQKKVRFIIMGNLFCSENPIHRCFDLKGSSHGRVTEKPETEIYASTTLKDLDLNFLFRLQKLAFQEFRRQVDRDCDFLEQERIMDYSLLVGLHFRNIAYEKDLIMAKPSGSRAHTARDNHGIAADQIPDSSRPLGVNMLARAELTERCSSELQLVGEPTGEMYDVRIFFGIIDILQDYDISKKLEHAYKSMQYDATSISAVDPKQYSRRFRDFIFKVFAEDS
ncbi:hypothetical protein MLD38_024076 [Melastoma candidum]|uniref:Uncharacterized protein n=1 Tax=Melastoma candidum TaxID=119954 RepID=A0ACB9NSW9_9MYRT|nr:hypothetical protein MLD38_024076 [Melastoma candidum]